MRNTIFAILSATTLVACGPDREGTFDTADGGEGSYAIDEDGDTVTAEITGGDGEQMSLEIGGDLDAALPSGFTVYPGASVEQTASMGRGEESGSMVALESSASTAELIAHYRREAEAAGYEVEMEARSGDTQTFTATKDTDTLMVQAFTEGSGSTAMLMFQRDQ